MGGLKEASAKELMAKHPTDLIIMPLKACSRKTTGGGAAEETEGIRRVSPSSRRPAAGRTRYLILENKTWL